MKSSSTNVSIQKDHESSEVEITAEIPAQVMERHYEDALEKARGEAEVDGFRKGKAPKEAVESQIGEGVIMRHAAESALQDEYPLLLAEHEIRPLGRPDITITKIAKGSELGFRIKTALMPEVVLGDYKKDALEALKQNPRKETHEVDEKEIEDVIKNIRTSKALEERKQRGEEAVSPDALKEDDLPELTDEFASSLGNFKNVSELKENIKKHLLRQKETQETEKRRVAILDALIGSSTIPTPDILVQSELDKMVAQLKDDVARAGFSYENYLEQIKKTEEDIRSEWRENATKRAQTQLLLNKIASEENIKPEDDQVESQVKHLKEHYKDADPENIRVFVTTQMTNDKVLSFLESLDGADPAPDTHRKNTSTDSNKKETEGDQKDGSTDPEKGEEEASQ